MKIITPTSNLVYTDKKQDSLLKVVLLFRLPFYSKFRYKRIQHGHGT